MQVALRGTMPRYPLTRSAGALLAAVVLLVLVRPAAAVSYKAARSFEGEYSYGNALAANDAHLVIGGFFAGHAAGKVDLYDRATGTLRAELTSPAPGGFFFGHDVALDGDLLVVGEQEGGTTIGFQWSGAVHTFDAATGAHVRTLAHPDPERHINLGTAVAASNGVIVASAPFSPWGYDEPGVVYVYDAASGDLLHALTDPQKDLGDFFGIDVALAGAEVLVGETRSGEAGSVWRFDLATGAPLGALTHPDPDAEGFGAVIAVDGSRVAVGGAGEALLFDLASGDLLRTITTPFPDGAGFAASLDIGDAGVLVAQPPAGRQPVTRHVGAVVLFDAASGAISSMLAEPESRYFPRRALFAGDDLFVTGGDDERFVVRQYVVACGDGILDACERCDDGNRADGDGCDATCALESCGDGALQAGEDCDDGNAVDGDGCDGTCTISGCGNCVVAADEACDDGNTESGDACDANCTFAACGNGAVGAFEICDDANEMPGDGCSPVCKAEVCGDGVLDAGESCDDGGLAGGDGCDAACRLETAKLDWWKQIYGVYAGDFNSYYGRRQVTVSERDLFVLTQYDPPTVARVYDRETGEFRHEFETASAGPLEPMADGVLVGDTPESGIVVRLYEPDSFALRQLFTDPTPETPYDFGRYLAVFGETVLVQDGADHAVHLFDVVTGLVLRTLTEPVAPNAPSPARAFDFGYVMAPFGGGALLSGTHAAYLFDLATGTVLRTYTGPNGSAVSGSGVVPFGDDVLLPTPGGVVHLVDGATGAVRHTFVPPSANPSSDPWRVMLAGTDILLASVTAQVVHVYDGTTFVLRHTLRDPELEDGSCFGGWVAVTDLGVAVSDACHGEDRIGIVYLFDHARGQHVATIANPNADYRDFFAPRGAYDTTLLTWYQSGDDGVVNAWRPASDGALVPGEECDDGNLENGDGCDVNGTVTRCGNGFVTAGEACDDGNRRNGDGCEADCTLSFACAEGARLARARLTLRSLGGTPGDEQIVLTGHLTDADPGVKASTEGAQVLIVDAAGASVFELTARTAAIPPGPRGGGCGPRDGWRADRMREIYVNKSGALAPTCAPGSAAGLTRLSLGSSAHGRAVQLRARGATIPTFTSPLRVVVALGTDLDGTAGRCGGRTFAELDCRWNRRATSLVCH